jgi:hypothetical protein
MTTTYILSDGLNGPLEAGSPNTPVVVTGTPTSGQVIVATSATTADWGAASGGSVTLSGDVTGSSSANTVATIAGASGFVNVNCQEIVNFTNTSATISAATAALNINNPSSSGQTNIAFEFNGTVQCGLRPAFNGSINYAAPAGHQFYTSLGTTSPQLFITTTGVTINSGLNAGEAATAPLSFGSATVNPVINQIAISAASATGNNLTIQAQNSTGTTSIGGNLLLKSGTGTSTNGATQISAGATRIFSLQQQPSGTLPSIYFGSGSILANTYTLIGDGTNNYFNGATSTNLQVGGTNIVSVTSSNVNVIQPMTLNNAGTVPSSNPSSGGIVYETSGNLTHRGSSGSITTVAPTGSALTINSQAQIIDQAVGTCETVSSATPTTILTYSTVSGKGGMMTLTAISRATTTGTGIAVGNTSAAVYTLVWQNIAGTVTLSTAGISLVSGTNVTTAAALTAPELTASASTNVITIQVTNVALATIDSQVTAQVVVA